MPLFEVTLNNDSAACEWSVAAYPAYYPLAITSDCMDWILQHVPYQEWTHAPVVETALEQGGGKINAFTGIRFIFTDPDIAMRFKLTWA